MDSYRRLDRPIEIAFSQQPPADAERLHERLRAQLSHAADPALSSAPVTAELLQEISATYREHDRSTAQSGQELHVEVARRERVMARLRRITVELLGSAEARPDLADSTHLDHLSELIAHLVQEREQAKEQMDMREERFRALTENALDITAIVSAEGRIDYVSRSVEAVMGYTPAQLLGTGVLHLVHPEDADEVQRELKRVARSLPSEKTILARFRQRDGSWRVLEVAGNNWLEHPAVRGIVLNCRDITERTMAQDRVRRVAHHDEVTGLPNRSLFRDRAQQAMAQAERTHRSLALMFLDLDRFKHINDSLGHHIGDRLLQHMAERLTRAVRQMDTVARVGGDEFAIVLPDIRDVQDLTPLAAKLLEISAAPVQIEGNELQVSGSIGICVFPDDGTDLDTLMRNADTAMYHAKDNGRNNFQYFTPRMNEVAHARLLLETRLRRAIRQQEFVLHYQPVVSARTGGIVGMEALVRWQDPELGLVLPGQFIGVAEDAGLIDALGAWVLHEACRQSREWHDAGLTSLPVAVNLSAKQFRNRTLLETVSEALERSGLEPRYLELEIIETLLMEQSEQTAGLLERLNAMGLPLSIDDFGTGHSSLSCLTRFPIHKLKIDQSFVRDIGFDPADVAITSAVIALAHSLQLKVLAKGVETREQLEFLRQQGCHELQGYLFSEPLPAPELVALVRSWDARAYASRMSIDAPFIAV